MEPEPLAGLCKFGFLNSTASRILFESGEKEDSQKIIRSHISQSVKSSLTKNIAELWNQNLENFKRATNGIAEIRKTKKTGVYNIDVLNRVRHIEDSQKARGEQEKI